MSIYKSDEEREQRLHQWLCTQAHEGVDMAMGKLRKIEIDRGRRHGRHDFISTKAAATARALKTILDDIFQIDSLIEKEMKRRK